MRSRSVMCAVVACLGAAVGVGAWATFAGEPDIQLEGSEDSRAVLDAKSFKPFDASAIAQLTDWTGGEALTAESLKGNVVMFVTWSSWYKTSHEALRLSQGLHSRLGEKGLVVVGVHHSKGWEKAAEVATAQKVEFRTALDKNGEFRKAMSSSQDPDFFFVDRAGRLRYADVQTRSAEAAADLLVNETAEQAGAATAAVAAKPVEGEGAVAGTFAAPGAEAYKAAKWPKKSASVRSAKDFQGKPMPKPLGKEQKYLEGAAPDRTGKVTVVDFWATWCPPCRTAMPIIDDLQKKHKADAVFIGVSDEPESTVKAFAKKHPHSYPQATDTSKGASNALGIQGIPHVVILSTDGVIRWQGNPLDPAFRETVKAVIDADPGVKTRREGEKK